MKTKSLKQEDRVARKMSGRRQPASGAGMFLKGDVVSGRFLVECKTTGAASFSVTDTLLRRVCAWAEGAKKDPAVAVTLERMKKHHLPQDWILVPLDVFCELLEEKGG